jgi:hypothetical protein
MLATGCAVYSVAGSIPGSSTENSLLGAMLTITLIMAVVPRAAIVVAMVLIIQNAPRGHTRQDRRRILFERKLNRRGTTAAETGLRQGLRGLRRVPGSGAGASSGGG